MATPIRITFRENVDHFAESQEQFAGCPQPLLSEKKQNIFIALIIVAALGFAFLEEFKKRGEFWIPFLACVGVLLIMFFWYLVFKKLGLLKNKTIYEYRLTEKDRARIQETYYKKTGRNETLVVCEFDENGFQITPENEVPTSYQWTAISRAIEKPQGLIIYVRSMVYFWFPKRAFASDADYQTLIELMASQLRNFQKLKLENLTFIALGSNLGNSAEILEKAAKQLQAFSPEPLLKSSFWESTPVNCPPGSPNFINAVVGLIPQAGETPESLLEKLQALEKEFGRQPKKVLNEPRPLDLDLILFGQETRTSHFLQVPHPRALERKFVLQPLAEIAPDLVFPGQTKTVKELLEMLHSEEVLRRLI